jgi:hypothetical protein
MLHAGHASLLGALGSSLDTQAGLAAILPSSAASASPPMGEWATGRRKPRASSTFESFADGLGMPPAAPQALGLAAGTPAVVGMSTASSPDPSDLDAGLEYPRSPVQAAENVSLLWRADLNDQAMLERGLVTPSAWNEASLRWLVAPELASPAGSSEVPGGVRVGVPRVVNRSSLLCVSKVVLKVG